GRDGRPGGASSRVLREWRRRAFGGPGSCSPRPPTARKSPKRMGRGMGFSWESSLFRRFVSFARSSATAARLVVHRRITVLERRLAGVARIDAIGVVPVTVVLGLFGS